MAIPDILQQIVATKKGEVAEAKKKVPLGELQQRTAGMGPTRDFFGALTKTPRGLANVISEVKKASPSAGVIKANFDPCAIACAYQAAGADALSVLTDESYFHGHLDYIAQIHAKVSLPILRKDFLIDPYQVYQARAAQADAVLLIAEILSDEELRELHGVALKLGLAVLIELHDPENLPRLVNLLGSPLPEKTLVGINNRNLRNFQVSLETAIQLAPTFPQKNQLVAESGIRTPEDVQRLHEVGIRILLIGETLMRTGDIATTLKKLKGLA